MNSGLAISMMTARSLKRSARWPRAAGYAVCAVAVGMLVGVAAALLPPVLTAALVPAALLALALAPAALSIEGHHASGTAARAAGWLVAAFVALVAVRSSIQAAYTAFLPTLFAGRGWDASAYGALAGTFMLAAAIGNVATGELADRHGMRAATVWPLLLGVPAGLICLWAPSPATAFVACALAENKGVGNILAACEQLEAERPAARITAVAGGSGTERANGLANVLLLMHQPREKLPALMARHRIIIGQVHQGAVGMVELEAMACGRPVIAYFTYDAAYDEPPPFVNAHSGPEIAAAVERLLDDATERERLSVEGRGWVERNHNAAHIAERIEQLALRFAR